MMTLESLTTFIGWCTVLNMGILTMSSVALMLMRGPVQKIHARMSRLHS